MKDRCERCAHPLATTDLAAICSLESTFCMACTEELAYICPSCAGQLTARPTRTFTAEQAEGIAGVAGSGDPEDGDNWQQRLIGQVKVFMEPREQPSITVKRLIPAAPEVIFEVLASPDRHPEFDGSDTIQGFPLGPARLGPGTTFTMGMRVQGLQYRSVNHVVEFDEGRRIAWKTFGEVGGRKIVGGQKWRFELEPQAGGTLVRHTYDWSEAMAAKLTIEMPGFPDRFVKTGPTTLERLEQTVTAP